MFDVIPKKLEALAAASGLDILYACESGSRAWNIESPDSDYDVRFIYAHKDIDWYLSLDNQKDTIEFMDGLLDFSGWDVRKALQLAAKSNPSVLEWLHSPIVYTKSGFNADLKMIMMTQFSLKALAHHYISMAMKTYKTHWPTPDDVFTPVPLKKYFYVLRPLFAVSKLGSERMEMPPLDIEKLLYYAPLTHAEHDEFDMLLSIKRDQTESEGTGRFPKMDGFIEASLQPDSWARKIADKASDDKPNYDELQSLFIDTVKDYW
jgi:predicted nucleotidyltransferase